MQIFPPLFICLISVCVFLCAYVCLDIQKKVGWFFFCLFRAAPWHMKVQARDLMGTVAAGLHHSHSNTRSELHLQPTPQLMAMPDP